MDSLTFDDIPFETEEPEAVSAPEAPKVDFSDVPEETAAPEPTTDISFDDIPMEEESGMFSIAGRSIMRGLADSATSLEQTGDVLGGNSDELKQEAKVTASPDPELDRLLRQSIGDGWTDPNWWIANTVTPTIGSSPMIGGSIAGAVAGGYATRNPYGALAGAATGGAAGAMMQTLGPAYVQGLRDGLSEDEAFERAWVQTGVAGVAGAIAGALPGGVIFGKTATGALKAPVKEALFQMFVAQPGVGVTEQAIQTGIEGREVTLEDLAKGYVTETVTGGVLDTGEKLATGGFKPETVKEKGADTAEKTALQGNPIDASAGSEVDPAAAQAVKEQPVESPRDRVRRIAKERDQRATAPATPAAPPAESQSAPAPVAGTEPPVTVGDDPAAPTPEPEEEPVRTYTTSKGSTYQVYADGTTVRNKAARNDPGHEGDSGVKPRTAKTIYIDPAQVPGGAAVLSAAGVQGLGPQGARVVLKDGKATLATWNRQANKWGAADLERDIPFSLEPAPGLQPLELWKPVNDVPGFEEAYSGMHAGNEIVDLTGPVSSESVNPQGSVSVPEPEAAAPVAESTVEEPAAEQRRSELFDKAVEAVRGYNNASLGFMIGRLGIGEKRARKLIFELEDAGVITKPDKRGKRTVIRDEVTARGNPDTNTVPEAQETLELQRQALTEGKRRAVFYPEGTPPLPRPELENIGRVKVEGIGIFDFDKTKTTPKELREASKAGRLNDVLDLGPVNKEEVAQSAAQGATPVAVVERTPEGTEVKAAAGTEETAPDQVTALQAAIAAPENTVTVEDPRTVVAQRQSAAPPVRRIDPSTLTAEERQRLGLGVPNAPSQAAPVPKADQAKATSQARSQTGEAAPQGPRVLFDMTPEAVAQRKAADEARDQLEAERIAAEEAKVKAAEKEAAKLLRKENRAATIKKKVAEKSYASIEEEALDRATSGGANLEASDKQAITIAARIAKETFEQASSANFIDIVENAGELPKMGENLAQAVALARNRFVEAQKQIREATGKLTAKAQRALTIRDKVNYGTVTGHVIWLSDASNLAGRIQNMPATERGIAELISDVNTFVTNSEALESGDDAPLRERRKQAADAISEGRSQEEKIESIADIREREDAAGRDQSVAADTGEEFATLDEDIATANPADSTRVRPDEPVEEGVDYNVGKAAKPVTVQTKRKFKLLKRETIAGEETYADLDESTILQTVTFSDALSQAGDLKGGSTNRTITNRLLSRLSKQIGNVKVHIVPQESLDAMFPDRAPNTVDGYYDPGENYIIVSEYFISTGQFDARLLAHEGVHAYLAVAIELDKTLKKDFEDILSYLRGEVPNADNIYGLANIHELLAEAMSNPNFQNMLMSMKVPDSLAAKFDAPQNTLWQVLIGAIRKHLGFGRKDVDALSYVMRLGDRAETRAMKLTTKQRKFFGQALKEGLLSQGRRDYAQELKDGGVPDADADEIADLIQNELKDAVGSDLDGFIQDLIADYKGATSQGNDQTKAEKKTKEAKAQIDKEAKKIIRGLEKSKQELEDEAYLKVLENFTPNRIPREPRLLRVLMNNQLALVSDKFFGRETNPVRRIADLIEKRRTTKARYLEELAPIAEELHAAEKKYAKTAEGRKKWEAFTSLAHDATMANVHPDRPLEDHKYLGQNSMKGMWSKAKHPELAARYDALPDDLKELYAKTRDTLTETQNKIAYGLTEKVLQAAGHSDPELARRFFERKATPEDRALVGEIVADHIERAGELAKIEGPYFNLARRGDWVVQGTYEVTSPSNGKKIGDNVVEFMTRDEAIAYAESQDLRPTINRVIIDEKTGKTYFTDDDGTQVKATKADPGAAERYRVTVQNKHVEFFHSKKEARAAAVELRKAGVKIKDVEPKRFERDAANSDMLSDQMRSLAATLERQQAYSSLTDAQKSELKKTLNEASLRFLASTRIQSHRLPRRYVQGASRDLTLNTYDYVDSASGYLAKLDTQLELETAMRQMEKAVGALSDRGVGLGSGARAISNEISDRVLNVDYDLDNGVIAGISNRVMMMNFINHLASPFYSVLQTMQVGMLTWPKLMADYGEARASLHLAKAYYDIGALRTGVKGIADTAKAVAAVSTPGRSYVDDIKARLKNANEKKMIDDLISLGVIDADAGFEVNRLSRKDSRAIRAVDATLGYFSGIARQAPQAIEAINRSVTALAAYRMEFAKSKDYAKALRAAQETVELTQFNLSASNAAPVFRNPVGRLLLQFKKYGQNVYFLLGRELGRSIRPMNKGDRAKAVKALVYLGLTHQAMAGMMGLPWEPVKLLVMGLSAAGLSDDEWEDWEDWAQENFSESFLYGLPRLVDMNLSPRVGMSDLMLYGEPGDLSDRESVKSWMFDLLVGPSAGSAQDILSGVNAIGSGKFLEGIEKLVPVKVIGDGIRAVRELDEGKFDVSDAILRTIGVQSARQANIQEKRGDSIDKSQEIKRKKNAIIKDWIAADTRAEKVKIIARMREYNRDAGKRDQLSLRYLDNIKRRDRELYKSE